MRRAYLLTVLFLLLAGCAAIRPAELPAKVMVLAPFEGTYAEIGYGALYAARLALTDSAAQNIELVLVDDGGLSETALYRARAAAEDDSVRMVIVLGYAATEPDVLAAFGQIPVIIVGDWGAQSASNVYRLTNMDIAGLVDNPRLSLQDAVTPTASLLGGEIYGMQALVALLDSERLGAIRVVTSGALPDEAFRARIMESDLFATAPHHLGTLVYDAVRLAVEAIQTDTPLSSIRYEGLNGVITFTDGLWSEAPLYIYRYDTDGQLITP